MALALRWCQSRHLTVRRIGDRMNTPYAVSSEPLSLPGGSNDEELTRAMTRGTGPDDGLSSFLRVRPRLLGIAFRILGSVAEAEDIVQDVWVRWQTTNRSRVCNPVAFLVTAATRLAINVLHSARARKETCAGEWLPELVDTGTTDPGTR